jgi:hypothetical protein
MAPAQLRLPPSQNREHYNSCLRRLVVVGTKQRRWVVAIIAVASWLAVVQRLFQLHQQVVVGVRIPSASHDETSLLFLDAPLMKNAAGKRSVRPAQEEQQQQQQHNYVDTRRQGNAVNPTTLLVFPTKATAKASPKIKLLLTDYGWNSPDPAIANDRFRTLRSKAMLEALQRHAHFDRWLWHNLTTAPPQQQQQQQGKQVAIDPHTHYYIFLDLETCLEKNWPKYGRRLDGNTDLENNRSAIFRWTTTCQALEIAAKSMARLFHNNKRSTPYWAKMVLLDCGGYGPEMCLARRPTNHQKVVVPSSQGTSWYALASISANVSEIDSSLDQGLPPPPILTTILPEQLEVLSNQSQSNNPWHDTMASDEDLLWSSSSYNSSSYICQKERPLLLFFAGNFRSAVRKALQQIHDPLKSIITNPDYRKMRRGGFALFYQQLLQSNFGAVPRGDNLFSYRFTEVLTAGAIPVVYADGWV